MLHKFIHTLSMCITIYLVATASSFAFTDKQGPFEWHPEKSSRGPVVIIVSLTDQQVSVYRGGIRIARAPVSTGKPGHRTPTGVFTILQKDVHHHSSKYNNASMPYAERLTWSGVALHAGGLPGYPESPNHRLWKFPTTQQRRHLHHCWIPPTQALPFPKRPWPYHPSEQ